MTTQRMNEIARRQRRSLMKDALFAATVSTALALSAAAAVQAAMN